jgi:hypothetical protein
MRSLWLASAAFIVISSTAFAQTAPAPGMSNPGNTQGTMSPPGAMAAPAPDQGMMSPMQPPSTGQDAANHYLWQARTAIRQHHRAQADNMLSHAETLILTRSVPQTSGPTPDNSPRVTAIENARAAVKQGNWTEAAQYTDQAMHHGAMSNGGMSPGTMSPNGNNPMAQPNRTVQ